MGVGARTLLVGVAEEIEIRLVSPVDLAVGVLVGVERVEAVLEFEAVGSLLGDLIRNQSGHAFRFVNILFLPPLPLGPLWDARQTDEAQQRP